jgi:hypothetical protein
VGVFQARWVAVAAGALTLALTYRVGARLVGAGTALLAVLLLLAWQWAPANAHALVPTGIPLIDVSRVVRHDILVAPLGLAAWWASMRSRGKAAPAFGLASGVFTGLSGLAHLYGLFWAPALAGLMVMDQTENGRRSAWLRPALLAVGILVVWAPVVGYLARYPDDFAVQARQGSPRFQVTDSAFYVDNLRNEIHRYHLGVHDGTLLIRAGGWALVLGVPVALAWLGVRAVVRRDRRALWLWAPSVAFPSLFALLIQPKTFSYLIAVAPLFALALAAGLVHLAPRLRRPARWGLWAAAGLIVIQGALSIAQMHRAAAGRPRPTALFTTLQQLIPREARIVGHRSYWIGLPDREYRCFGLAFILTNGALSPSPVDFTQALDRLAPGYIVLDASVRDEFTAPSTPAGRRNADAFWAYLETHDARLMATLAGLEGEPLDVYALDR